MRILTNITKAELNYLTSQPTAKAMIEKVKTEGISDSGEQKNQKQDSLQISAEGKAASQKDATQEDEITALEERVKNLITSLKEELAEIKTKPAASEKAKKIKDTEIKTIKQEIFLLTMQLVELEKEKRKEN